MSIQEEQSVSSDFSAWLEVQQVVAARSMQDEDFRRELLDHPRIAVDRELGRIQEGAKLPGGLEVRVMEKPFHELYCMFSASGGAPDLFTETLPTELEFQNMKAFQAVRGECRGGVAPDYVGTNAEREGAPPVVYLVIPTRRRA